MHHFFIPPEWIDKDSISISGEQVHQIREVLRLKSGDGIVVLDNTGMEYQVELRDITREKVVGKVIEQGLCPNEPEIKITLYQALLKGDKFEWVLQKCTEVGVTRFVPIVCERCVASIPSESRFERWKKIIVEAAEQSKRGIIPDLGSIINMKQVCEEVDGLSIMPWEQENSVGIKAQLNNIGTVQHVNIFIGPEGGFGTDEVEYARGGGIVPVSLGKRIFRAETAGLVTTTILMYEAGEIN